MKYIIQEDDISCGAVAIYNALVHHFITPKPSVKSLIESLGIESNNGCHTGDLLEELVKYLSVKQDDMKEYEKEAFGFIMEYKLDDGDMHFSFGFNCVGKVRLYNHCKKREYCDIIVEEKELKKILKQRSTKVYRLFLI